jgi:hypothetical protein
MRSRKKAIVADDDGAAGEVEQRLFERPQHVDIEVVGRLVEQQYSICRGAFVLRKKGRAPGARDPLRGAKGT